MRLLVVLTLTTLLISTGNTVNYHLPGVMFSEGAVYPRCCKEEVHVLKAPGHNTVATVTQVKRVTQLVQYRPQVGPEAAAPGPSVVATVVVGSLLALFHCY